MHTGSGPGHRTHTCPRAASTHLSAGQPPSHLTATFRAITTPATSSKEQLSWAGTHTHSHPSKGRARVQTMALSHPPSGRFSHANPPSHFLALGGGALARTLPDRVTWGPDS